MLINKITLLSKAKSYPSELKEFVWEAEIPVGCVVLNIHIQSSNFGVSFLTKTQITDTNISYFFIVPEGKEFDVAGSTLKFLNILPFGGTNFFCYRAVSLYD